VSVSSSSSRLTKSSRGRMGAEPLVRRELLTELLPELEEPDVDDDTDTWSGRGHSYNWEQQFASQIIDKKDIEPRVDKKIVRDGGHPRRRHPIRHWQY
jgi:hypothetical protein